MSGMPCWTLWCRRDAFLMPACTPGLPRAGGLGNAGVPTFERQSQWVGDRTAGSWVREHILELTYTAWDLQPFAKDCGYDGPTFRWDENRRFLMRCEFDAAFCHLDGVDRDDVDHILETFPIVKPKVVERHGECRTQLVIFRARLTSWYSTSWTGSRPTGPSFEHRFPGMIRKNRSKIRRSAANTSISRCLQRSDEGDFGKSSPEAA